MPILDAFERGVLFTLTRLTTLMIIIAFCIPIVISGIIYYHFFGAGPHVDYDDIHDELHPQSSLPYPKVASKPEASQTSSQVNIPSSLQQYFDTPEARQELLNHLVLLDAEAQGDYLNNLAEVVKTAQFHGEDIPQVIQQYFQDKDRHIGRTPTDAAFLWGSRIALALLTISTLILVALASLILVLLAIERNTRGTKVIRA